MSDISSVTGAGTGSLVDYLIKREEESTGLNGTNTAAENLLKSVRKNKQAQDAYGGAGLSSSVGQAALKRALSEMGASGGKVTFADIAAYQKQLETTFSVELRVALAAKGVSPETEFTLNISSDGVVSVNCDDPVAKEKIEKYLEDNPKVCEQFGYIQALANLDRARQSQAAVRQDMKNTKAELQASAIESFFGNALNSGMNFSSMLASFGAGGNEASYYTGVDYLV